MALVKCSECGREVSDKAAACPQCGAPVAARAASPAPPPAPPPPTVAPVAALGASGTSQHIVRFIIGMVVLFSIVGGVGYVVYAMKSGASLRGAVAGPQTVVSETLSLDEGSAMGFGFTLPTPRRVEVSVTATPRKVNVMLMNESDWEAYNKARGKLFGGKYTYRQALSRESVLNMKESDVLPAGSWRVVVERPVEDLFGAKATAATVTILAF